ncbi:MAG: hypothetical protein RTU92_05290 [Candidatus Thorarchaeota archaeon]
MNNKTPDKVLTKYYMQTKQRAVFKAPRTELGYVAGFESKVVDGLVNRQPSAHIPTKVVLRYTIDEPQMMRLFNICDFMACK